MEEQSINLTAHAISRGKERLKWNENTLLKMAGRAYNMGVKHSDTKGSLNRYITSIWNKNKAVNNIRIYGENLFLFTDTKLITVYRLDHKICKKLNHSVKNQSSKTQ